MSTHTPYRICVVCSGNICRSPMGESVLRSRFAHAGLSDEDVVVDSAGTGAWHVGGPADRRTVTALTKGGYGSARPHVARSYDVSWFAHHDLVLAADVGHLRWLRREAQAEGYSVGPPGSGADVELTLLREFDPEAVAAGTLDVDDPYYGGAADFDRCLEQVEGAADGVVDYVVGVLAHR